MSDIQDNKIYYCKDCEHFAKLTETLFKLNNPFSLTLNTGSILELG